MDDAYALVLAATSDRLDLRAVTTVNAKVEVRSAIARKLLLLVGRPDVPVASGGSEPRDGHKPFWGGWEGKGLLVWQTVTCTGGDSRPGDTQEQFQKKSSFFT